MKFRAIYLVILSRVDEFEALLQKKILPPIDPEQKDKANVNITVFNSPIHLRMKFIGQCTSSLHLHEGGDYLPFTEKKGKQREQTEGRFFCFLGSQRTIPLFLSCRVYFDFFNK